MKSVSVELISVVGAGGWRVTVNAVPSQTASVIRAHDGDRGSCLSRRRHAMVHAESCGGRCPSSMAIVLVDRGQGSRGVYWLRQCGGWGCCPTSDLGIGRARLSTFPQRIVGATRDGDTEGVVQLAIGVVQQRQQVLVSAFGIIKCLSLETDDFGCTGMGC